MLLNSYNKALGERLARTEIDLEYVLGVISFLISFIPGLGVIGTIISIALGIASMSTFELAPELNIPKPITGFKFDIGIDGLKQSAESIEVAIKLLEKIRIMIAEKLIERARKYLNDLNIDNLQFTILMRDICMIGHLLYNQLDREAARLHEKLDNQPCFYHREWHGDELPQIEERVSELSKTYGLTRDEAKKLVSIEPGMIQKVKELIYRWMEKEIFLKYYYV